MTREPPPDDVDPSAETLPSDEPPHHSAFESLLRQVARSPEADRAAPGAELSPGVLVADRFEVLEEIGRGGFAKVYRARDRVLSRPVAIKLLARRRRLSDRDLELFYREAQATARLNHVHIVTAHDWGEWNGAPFLVLELLEGEPLSAVLARGPVPEARAWAIARDVARAVAYAHSQGVLHLDLKSQNVFVLADGRLKVLDFGLAGLEWDEELPGGLARVAGGTPATMAPEQAESRDTDARTDVWAVGVIFHELLVGRVPKLPADAATAPLPSGVSRRAEDVLRRTLARDPAARFPDAAALLAALAPPAPPRRRLLWALLGLAVAAAATATIAALITRQRTPRPPAATTVVPAPPERHRQLTFTGDVDMAEISPTGDSFAYLADDNRELWLREIESSEARRIFAGELLDAPRWFPDGARLVVRRLLPEPRTLWVIPADGGEPREIPSRDGRSVPISADTLATFARTYDGKATLLLSPLGSAEGRTIELPSTVKLTRDLDAAPDGRILLTAWDQLWSLGPGPAAESLLSGEDIWSARWDAAGKGVFWIRGLGRDTVLQWLPTPPEGAQPMTLFGSEVIGPETRISISRDGRRLLYHRESSATQVHRLAGDGKMTPLIRGTAQLAVPVVSREGRMAYSLIEDRTHYLVVTGLEPGAPHTRILRCPVPCGSPVWSADGRRIAYKRDERDGSHIATIAFDGSDQKSFPRSRPIYSPIAPVGEWLSPTEILYAADDGSLRVLDLSTGDDRAFLSEPITGMLFSQTVSPDGARVALTRWTSEEATRGIYLVDRAGANARRLIGGRREPIAWRQADELLVALIRPRLGVHWLSALERVDVRTGAAVELWKAPAELDIIHVTDIPGTEGFVLLEYNIKSDAWLIEDPLGASAR